MSKAAIDTLERAKEALIKEIEMCGQSGGIGRSMGFAPQLVAIDQSIQIIKESMVTEKGFAERMAEAKAAKKAAQ